MRTGLFVGGLMGSLTACAPGAAGTWTGTCEIDDAQASETYDIQALELSRDGDALAGTAIVQPDWQLEPFTGSVSGEQAGALVTLDMRLGDVTQGFVLTADATLDGDVIDGTCTATVAESALEGVFAVERAP